MEHDRMHGFAASQFWRLNGCYPYYSGETYRADVGVDCRLVWEVNKFGQAVIRIEGLAPSPGHGFLAGPADKMAAAMLQRFSPHVIIIFPKEESDMAHICTGCRFWAQAATVLNGKSSTRRARCEARYDITEAVASRYLRWEGETKGYMVTELGQKVDTEEGWKPNGESATSDDPQRQEGVSQ